MAGRKRFNLTSERQRLRSEHPDFELQIPEVPGEPEPGSRKKPEPLYPEKIVLIPAPQNLPDEFVELSGRFPVAAAQNLLGDDYAHYKAAGGTANLLMALINDYAGVGPGESGGSSDS